MLQSLLLACLFFGLISMILPSDRRSEWICLLLIFVLVISVGSTLLKAEITFPLTEEAPPEEQSVLPETAALHSVVSSRVLSLTGESPVSVESDLECADGAYTLTWIRVVIRTGNEKEVQNALQDAFSFEGITVLREEPDGSGYSVNLSP